MCPGPVLWGGNNTSNNLQNQELLATGTLLSYNGPKNYISYSSFENQATTGWSLGTTGALTNGIPTGTPTFGSGSTNLTISAVNAGSGAIGGTYSLSMVSSTTSTIGNMLASQAYTIDLEDQAKVLTFKFYYSMFANATAVNFSGTSSNSFGVAVWDVTNSSWLSTQGAFSMTQNNGTPGIASGTCQTNATTTQVRFVVYNVNASTASYTIILDDFFLGPQTAPIGPVVTDWQTYTAGTQGFGTPVFVDSEWRRVGTDLEVRAKFTTGTTNASEARLNFPPGLVSSSTLVSIQIAGQPMANNGGSASLYMPVVESAVSYFTFGANNAATSSLTKITGNAIGSAVLISLYARAPISGWSSNVQMSNDTDARVVAGASVGSTATVTSSYSTVTLATINNDTHGSFNAASNATSYTIPVSGFYDISGQLLVSAASASAGQNVTIGLLNSTSSATIRETVYIYEGTNITAQTIAFNYEAIFFNAGTVLNLQIKATSTTPAISASSTQNFFSISRRSGPSVIAAAESVNMKYTNTAGTSIPNTADNNVPFATKVYDSHNAYNTSTGIYTVPVSGKYAVQGTINYASATYGVNNQVLASVYKNGAIDSYGDIAPIMAIVTLPFGSVVDTTISCNAGDTLEIRAQNTRTAGATTLNTGAGFNHIEIERIGN